MDLLNCAAMSCMPSNPLASSDARRRAAGFTLLEVILSLVLAVVLISLIGIAIRTYLRAADASRLEVQEAQVARNVLNLIAKDLKSSVLYDPMDVSDLVGLMGPDISDILEKLESVEGLEGISDLSGEGAGDAGSGAPSTLPSSGGSFGGIDPDNISEQDVRRLLDSIDPQNPPSLDELREMLEGGSITTGGSGGSSDEDESDDEEGDPTSIADATGSDDASSAGTDEEGGADDGIANSELPPSQPGLFGNRFELMVDASRLPRLDEYTHLYSSTDTVSGVRPSDVKSIAYYVVPPVAGPAGDSQSGGGLARRSLDRAVTRWQAENGTLGTLAGAARILAPEVVALEFRYFDGVEWFTEWDSLEREGLPMAVEVAVAIARQTDDDTTFDVDHEPPSLFDRTAESEPPYRVYRRLVRLPVAQATDEATLLEEELLEQEESEDEGSGDSATGSSSRDDDSGTSP